MNKTNMVQWLLFTCCIIIFNSCTYLPEPNEIEPAFRLTETAKYIQIENRTNAETGIIFYPGGFVDAHAYVKTLTTGDSESLNSLGSLKSFIVKMPVNLAVLNAQAAIPIIEDNPTIKKWYLAGHSLGGAMACTAVDKNRELFDGLILMAAYPAANVDLSNWEGKVLSLRGTNDGLTTQADIDDTKSQLPANTLYINFEGGNHAGFGNYGAQKDDGENLLINPSQIDLTQTAIIDFVL